MAPRITALCAVSFVTLVYCGGQAVVQTTPDGGDGGASSSSSGGSGSGGSSGSTGSSGGSSSGTGSSSSGSAQDASDDAPACGHYDGGTRPAPTNHRAQPGTCPANTVMASCLPPYADAGAGAACTTSADCVPDGSYTPYSTCLHGHCAVDHCLADSDCASGQACLCGSLVYGNAPCFQPNQCVPADCRLDSDCGAGKYCSPNPAACGIESAYHCHKATDSCFDDADCTCAGGYSTCAYSSTAGAWVCAQITCAG